MLGVRTLGLRPSHLKGALDGRRKLVATLDWLVTLCEDGRLPAQASSALCAANPTSLRKDENGVRLVAVGKTLRWLVGKSFMAGDYVAEVAAQLLPLQSAVKVSDPCLTTTTGCQQWVTRLPSNGPLAVLQVDLRNAFNSINREEVLVVVSHHAPQPLA